MIKCLQKPRWQTVSSTALQSLSPSAQQWLGLTESMTEAFKTHFDFTFAVLNNTWNKPNEEEALLLQSKATIVTREVSMGKPEIPLLYGRTLFPKPLWQSNHEMLLACANRPLGEWLFSHADCKRLSLEYTAVNKRHTLWHQAHFSKKAAALWARRSLFTAGNYYLLVYEVFSPELVEEKHE